LSVRTREHSRQYLEGLLAPIEWRNGWTIAEHVGEKEPKAMQRFLNLASWAVHDLRDLNLDYVIEHLGDRE
jgi:SRSO17 transposase